VEDVLHLPDGRIIHPRLVWGVLKGRPEVRRYQLVQEDAARFELNLVLDDPAGDVVPAIVRDMEALLGDVAIEVRLRDDIPPDPGGKFRAVRGLPRR
jgi:hypothetical protein